MKLTDKGIMRELAEKFLPYVTTKLAEYSGPFTPEIEVQDHIQTLLEEANIKHKRECQLGEFGRIDFLVEPGIGLEIKVDGSPASVTHQLWRYCKSPEIECIVLVTTRARLTPTVSTILDKQLRTVELWRSAF